MYADYPLFWVARQCSPAAIPRWASFPGNCLKTPRAAGVLHAAHCCCKPLGTMLAESPMCPCCLIISILLRESSATPSMWHAMKSSERGEMGPGWVKTDMTGGSGLITTAQARSGACHPGACYPQRVYAACNCPAQFTSASRMVACMVPRIVSGRIWGRPTGAELMLQASGFGVLVMGLQASRMACKLTVTNSVVDKVREG